MRQPPPATNYLTPRVVGPIVRRSRLVGSLRDHLDRKLLLITADAGYGKTTLLAGFIDEVGLPCAWCRLEPMDSDPVVFLDRLIDAVRLHFPGFGGRIHAGGMKREAVTAHLVNDLGALPDIIIALDDYHLVDDSGEVNLLVDGLLDHLPSSARIIIASRTTPHLSLSRLRAQNNLYEVDATALRFSIPEIEALFTQLGFQLDPDTLQMMASRTEGWVLALMLAYHSIKERGPTEITTLLRALRGSARYIYGYLSAEVFRAQPVPVQAFLRATSILPRLHADICDAIVGGSAARGTLRYLERNNLFTHATDEERIWYRYHPLFQEFLQNRLLSDEGATRVAELHCTAGGILEHHGMLEEAFEQYGRAGEWTEAGRLLSVMGRALLEAGRMQTLAALLGQIPEQVVNAMPELLLQRAKQLELPGRWAEARGLYQRALGAFSARDDSVGRVRALLGAAMTHFRQGQYPQCLDLCEQARVLVTADDRKNHAEVLRLIAGCYLETDDLERGALYMEDTLRAFRALGDRGGEAISLHDLAYSVHFVRGEFRTAVQMEEEAVRICDDLSDIPRLTICLIGLAHLRLVTGMHSEALAVLERLLRLCEEWRAEAVRAYALVLQADAYRELGDGSRARTLYDEGLVLGERLEEPTARLHAMLGLAVLLRRTDRDAADALARRALTLARELRYEWFHGRGLMVLGWVTASAREDDPEPLAALGFRAEAAASLEEAVRIFEHLGARYDLARAHLFLAALRGHPNRLTHLEKALTIGERGGYDALLLHTERESAQPLLIEAVAQGIRPGYAGRLILALGDRKAIKSLRPLIRRDDPQVREVARRVIDGLSRRPALPLRVHLLGSFKLRRGAEEIPDAAWKRSTAKILFQYLAHRYPDMSSEDAILEALWPDAPPASAHGAFHTALHALRKVLEPDLANGRDSAYVLSRSDQYGLTPQAACWVDVREFEQLAHRGKMLAQDGRPDEALAALREADRLYGGDFMEDALYQEWSAPERERLRQIEVDVLSRLGDLLADSDPAAAIDVLRRAVGLEPYSEQAYRGLMRLLASTGQRAEALRQYQVLERLLAQDLQTVPSPETTALSRQILSRPA